MKVILTTSACLVGVIAFASRYSEISVYGYLFILPLVLLGLYELVKIYIGRKK